MFEKNMRLAVLLDFYGDVLDEHTRNIMTAYYEDDLSLAEIAEDEGISRQGVRHVIKKGEEELEFLESKLRLSNMAKELWEARDKTNALRSSLINKGFTDEDAEIKLINEISRLIINKGV